jgi:hypothetical protein
MEKHKSQQYRNFSEKIARKDQIVSTTEPPPKRTTTTNLQHLATIENSEVKIKKRTTEDHQIPPTTEITAEAHQIPPTTNPHEILSKKLVKKRAPDKPPKLYNDPKNHEKQLNEIYQERKKELHRDTINCITTAVNPGARPYTN